MSSSRRLATVCVAIVLAALAGCGFRPLHERPGNTSITELERIKVDPIADRTGQILRNRLLSKITPDGAPKSPLYVLKVRLRESTRALAIRRDEVATRANLTMTATYTLLSVADNKPVISGTARSIVSYNILTEDFATISSRVNAQQRSVRQLSDEIHKRLSISLSRRPPSR